MRILQLLSLLPLSLVVSCSDGSLNTNALPRGDAETTYGLTPAKTSKVKGGSKS